MQFPICRGAVGSDVALIQDRLNRVGALLEEDGHYGGGTEAAVADARTQLNLPSVQPGVDQALWNALDVVPEPCSLLPTRGVTFIAIEEVSSRQLYDRIYNRPSWPGGQSGVTIGVGYDLRFASPEMFDTDWRPSLDDASYEALLPWLGKLGSAEAASALANTTQPFIAAWSVFGQRTIPNAVNETHNAFSGYDDLPPLCQSALVSLVYNRGPSMDGDRRVEMRAIRDLIAAGNYAGVPAQLVAMQHLWPDAKGLRDRRVAESQLWQDGLAG